MKGLLLVVSNVFMNKTFFLIIQKGVNCLEFIQTGDLTLEGPIDKKNLFNSVKLCISIPNFVCIADFNAFRLRDSFVTDLMKKLFLFYFS